MTLLEAVLCLRSPDLEPPETFEVDQKADKILLADEELSQVAGGPRMTNDCGAPIPWW